MTAPAPDLYLPPSSLPLYHALALALAGDHPAEIAYLADYAPIPAAVVERLRARFAPIRFSVRFDRDAIESFASLPRALPAVLRRNWAPRRGALWAGPADAPPEWLGARYRDAHIFTTGQFLPKTLRQRAGRIILHEEGLGSYHSLPLGLGKALLRGLWGRSPRHHFMGEEPWVDRIEISAPEALPPPLRAKAVRVDMEGVLASLPARTRQDIAAALWTGPAPQVPGRAALILTQPLAALGFCTPQAQQDLYLRMAAILDARGFQVFFKRHPQEADAPADDRALPAFFPIEAWPDLTAGRFALAVSLCSSASGPQSRVFAQRGVRLVSPEAFARRDLTGWDDALRSHLEQHDD